MVWAGRDLKADPVPWAGTLSPIPAWLWTAAVTEQKKSLSESADTKPMESLFSQEPEQQANQSDKQIHINRSFSHSQEVQVHQNICGSEVLKEQ